MREWGERSDEGRERDFGSKSDVSECSLNGVASELCVPAVVPVRVLCVIVITRS